MATIKRNGIDKDEFPYQIFDRMFKRLLRLSSGAVICFINALFGTKHPLTASVEYLSTEHITDKLDYWVGDILLLIDNRHKYWIEAQMKEEEGMAFRIWNYTYLEGLKTKQSKGAVTRIKLVPAIVIYLESTKNTPDELILEIEDADKNIHPIKYKTLKLLDYSMAELEERNLSILLPFYLLKLRKRVVSTRSKKGLEKLSLEMIELIKELGRTTDLSVKKGKISREDVAKMIGLIQLLYKKLYNDTELKEAEKAMEELLLTEVDIALDEAKKEGEKKGKAEAKAKVRKIALNMLRKGFSNDQVAEMTELSLRDVKSLTKQLQN